MCRVRAAAAAIKISGEAIVSQPVELVLADPDLVVAEPVEVLDQRKVTLQGQRWIFTWVVDGLHKEAKAHGSGHGLLAF